MGSIVYSATKLKVPGKRNIIPQGENGWYRQVPVGGLGCFNSAGAFYLLEESRAAFDKSSDFIRRTQEGSLYSEFGHPKMEPGMRMDDFIHRARQIYEGNSCNVLSNITLLDNGARDQQNRPICLITADVKPYGVHGKVCSEALSDPEMNTCYSIRCITSKRAMRGIEYRTIEEAYTFDLVLEPGIFQAKKRFSPALESYNSSTTSTGNEVEELEINSAIIKSLKSKAMELSSAGVSLESTDQLNDMVIRLESYYKKATSTSVPFAFTWGS